MPSPFDEDDKEAIIAALERKDRIAFAAVIARMKSIAKRAEPIDGLADVVIAPVPQTALEEIATVLLVQTMSEMPDAPRIVVPPARKEPSQN